MVLHWFSILNLDLSLSLATTSRLNDRIPSLDFWGGGRVGLKMPTGAGHVLNKRLKKDLSAAHPLFDSLDGPCPQRAPREEKETHSLPRGRGLLHNGVIYRGILTDVVDPRVPLGRHL